MPLSLKPAKFFKIGQVIEEEMGKHRTKPLTVEAINDRLKMACIPVRVVQNGNALALRATLPPKPNSGHVSNHRYDISLGIPASTEGLSRIEAEAQALGSLIARGVFRWEQPYYEDRSQPPSNRVCDWVVLYRQLLELQVGCVVMC
jgi:hypothetical protein